MAASVRIEDEAFSDRRYDVLAHALGLPDADCARGKMASAWRQCTAQQTHVLVEPLVIAILGPKGPEALVTANLGERVEGGVRFKGTKGRIEWLAKLRRNASKGGKVRAAKRQAPGLPKGRHLAEKNSDNGVPDACPPAPAPAPALRRQRQADPLFDAIAEVTGSDPHTAGSHVARVKNLLAGADPPYSPDEVREFGRRFGALCGWAVENGKARQPTVNEVEKYIGRVRADRPDPELAASREMGRRIAAERAAADKAKPSGEDPF